MSSRLRGGCLPREPASQPASHGGGSSELHYTFHCFCVCVCFVCVCVFFQRGYPTTHPPAVRTSADAVFIAELRLPMTRMDLFT